MERLFYYSFFVISAIDLALVCISSEDRYLTKPLIMLSLVMYILWTKRAKLKLHKAFLTAMCFAWLGDVFLLSTTEQFFMLGIGSFLITQILYTYSFSKQRQIGIHRHKFSILLVSFILIGWLLYVLSATGSMAPLISLYSISITAMLLSALMRWKVKGYYLIVIGALLFIASDGMIALSKFSTISYDLSLPIMLSYIAAQYMIVTGYMKSI